MAGAALGEVAVSLSVAGAAFGEIWNDSRSTKCCIFHYKMLLKSGKSNLGCEAGCGLTGSWSDHGRNGLGSAAHCIDVSCVFSKFLSDFGRSFFVAGAAFGDFGRCHWLLFAL